VIVRARDKKDKLRQGKLASRKAKVNAQILQAETARREKRVVAQGGQERRIVGLLSCRGERKITIVSGGNRRQLTVWSVFIPESPRRPSKVFPPFVPEGASAVMARSELEQ